MKIGISGASGQLGKTLLEELKARGGGHEIVGISRTPGTIEGAEARLGDYDRPETLAAAYAGLATPPRLPLGRALRFFGDGFQSSKRIGKRRYWRVPVMEGEFLAEDMVGTTKGIGGGNFLGKPSFNLVQHFVNAAIQLDAGPTQPAWIQPHLLDLLAHVIVMGFFTAVLQ